ncbi:reverse transcriptase domain-containing protein [Favolaschia claudopus]|uniref:Reverse transcriptase domain-containing protein n=1 Tax=Favolaschia claudopus TaxID=2862362 RepID=A0AAV9Z3G2_9AGAR
MLALAAFYSIQQGSSSFSEFSKALQEARSALASAGQGWVISDIVLKNHLLFSPIPSSAYALSDNRTLPFTTMKVDTLIATMSSTWDSLLAEGVIKAPRATPAPAPLAIPSVRAVPSSSSLPTPTSASAPSTFVPLTHAEKETLRAAGGCYHCRKTPASPGWVKHRSDNCPGDSALGIPPRSSPGVVAAVGPAGFSSTYEEGYRPVAVVMPAYDPEDDSYSYSYSSEDDDESIGDIGDRSD